MNQIKFAFTSNISFAYGEYYVFEITCEGDEQFLSNFVSNGGKLGIRVFENNLKVKEFRGEVLESSQSTLKFQAKLSAQNLKPGKHETEIGLVIDGLRWYDPITKGPQLNILPSDEFMDVKALIQKYSVEELSESAESYYLSNIDNPWLYRKPYSFKDISHNFPQVAALIHALKLSEGMKVMDFGAGTGWISRVLNKLGLEVFSVDVSSTALDISKKIASSEPNFYKTPPIHYVQFNGRSIPVAESTIDCIFCYDALHHVPNLPEVVKEFSRVLVKPGGRAGFCEPGARHSLSLRSQQEMKSFKVIENDINLEEIATLFRSNGATLVQPLLFYPYSIPIELEQLSTISDNESFSRSIKRLYASRAQQVNMFIVYWN